MNHGRCSEGEIPDEADDLGRDPVASTRIGLVKIEVDGYHII